MLLNKYLILIKMFKCDSSSNLMSCEGKIKIKKIACHDSKRACKILPPGEKLKVQICDFSSSSASSSSSSSCSSSSSRNSFSSKDYNCKVKCGLDSSCLPSGAILNPDYESSSSCEEMSGYCRSGCIGFRALVTPFTNLLSYDGETLVGFEFWRKSSAVIMSFQPFSGVIANNGVSYLVVNQTISDMPPYPVSAFCRISYNGIYKSSFVQIDPDSPTQQQIKIYLDITGNPIGNIGDTVSVDSCTVTWFTRT